MIEKDFQMSLRGLNTSEVEDSFGTVKGIGYPQKGMYYWYQLAWFLLTRRHPFPFKVGTRVLCPKGGRCTDSEGNEFFIFSQSDILCDDQ